MKTPTVDYQQEFFKAKIERAEKRKRALKEVWVFLGFLLATMAGVALIAAVTTGVVGGLRYDHNSDALLRRIDSLEQNARFAAYFHEVVGNSQPLPPATVSALVYSAVTETNK